MGQWFTATVSSVALAAALAAASLLAAFLTYAWGSESCRRTVSEGPMGIRRRAGRKARPHAIADVSGFADWRAWAASLPRSQRNTMCRQVDAAFADHGVVVSSISARDLGWGHLSTLYCHQLKVYNPVLAVLASAMRFLVARSMTGTVDQYRAGGRVVAWSHTVIKGNTLRGMWFYQRPVRMQIW